MEILIRKAKTHNHSNKREAEQLGLLLIYGP